jgi:hypothetical protein
MRPNVGIMPALAIVVLCAANCVSALAGSKSALGEAKARIEKKHADEQQVLDSVPITPRHQLPPTDNTNVVWMDVAGVRLGFPGDQFRRDADPRRENVLLYHSKYRLMLSRCAEAGEFAEVMSFVKETNFFRFVRTALNSTTRQIKEQRTGEALERLDLLLTAKSMMAPLGFDDFCCEFDRGDLKGFIVGNPVQSKAVYVGFTWNRRRSSSI